VQRCRHRYDHIDLPEVRCGQCERRYRADPPTAMPLGTPFGLGVRALLASRNHPPRLLITHIVESEDRTENDVGHPR
jgi:hypothetical protein